MAINVEVAQPTRGIKLKIHESIVRGKKVAIDWMA